MIYKTDRIILEPLTREHLQTEQYRQWMNSPEVTRYNSHGLFPKTKADMDAFIESFESGRDLVWAIYTIGYVEHIKSKDGPIESRIISNSDYIGNISLQRINWIHRSAELAILIGNTGYWGKGIATEACLLALAHGFNRLNMHRIWTGTAATNLGMQRVAAKIGMTYEGAFREGMFLNGVYVNVKCYAILDYEWKRGNTMAPSSNG